VKRYLRRGIPSLFTDVKALYISEGKVGKLEIMSSDLSLLVNACALALMSGHHG
jgi:hypothetical protein